MLEKQVFKYWGFGLKIRSGIEFPELVPFTFETPDITISIGNIPALPGENFSKNQIFSYILGESNAFFVVDGSANYFVQNGTSITIEPTAVLNDTRFVRLFTLSFAIPAILWHRKLIPLHCAAIVHNNHLVCITGDSGAGKSTSVAGLSKNGYSIFSDDVVVITPSLKVNASYAIVKLWEDAQQKLNHDAFNDQSFAIKEGGKKFGISFRQTFDTGRRSIKKIIVVKKGDVSEITSKQLTKADAFLELRKQVYRRTFANTRQLQASAFFTVSRLVNKTSVYEITRPMTCNVDVLVNEIENIIDLDDK